jgi:hypothetical protein
LPSSALSMVRQAGLPHAEIHGPVTKRRIGVITRHGRSLSPAAQALIETLKLATAGDLKAPESTEPGRRRRAIRR